MLPLRFNCLLLHQFNELFFGDIWLPCPRVGEKVDYQEGRKMLLFSTFCLQIFLLLLLADIAQLFCMIDPHCYMVSSQHLHSQSPPTFLITFLHYTAESTQGLSLIFMISAKLFSPLRRPHYSTQEKHWPGQSDSRHHFPH